MSEQELSSFIQALKTGKVYWKREPESYRGEYSALVIIYENGQFFRRAYEYTSVGKQRIHSVAIGEADIARDVEEDFQAAQANLYSKQSKP